jgi:hypothetical protein
MHPMCIRPGRSEIQAQNFLSAKLCAALMIDQFTTHCEFIFSCSLFKVHFSILYTVIRPFWAIMTAVGTVRAQKNTYGYSYGIPVTVGLPYMYGQYHGTARTSIRDLCKKKLSSPLEWSLNAPSTAGGKMHFCFIFKIFVFWSVHITIFTSFFILFYNHFFCQTK